VGLHNLGYHVFFSKLFEVLGISMADNDHLSKYINNKDGRKECKREYQEKITVKLNRSQQQKKTRDEVFKECTDNSYGPGVGLTAGIVKKWKVDDLKAKPDKMEPKKCCKCGSTTHQRPTHQECLLNKNKIAMQMALVPPPVSIVTAPPMAPPLTTPAVQAASLMIVTAPPSVLTAMKAAPPVPLLTTPATPPAPLTIWTAAPSVPPQRPFLIATPTMVPPTLPPPLTAMKAAPLPLRK
jgi:hypothetical protein